MNPAGVAAPVKINDPTNLDEVVVTAKKITPIAPAEEVLPEITVTGTRIQWWQWLLGGAALAGIVTMFTKE